LKGGVLKVRVVEGFVGGVVIEGEKLTPAQNRILQSKNLNLKFKNRYQQFIQIRHIKSKNRDLVFKNRHL
jgi:hemolysin activation/secretion protein